MGMKGKGYLRSEAEASSAAGNPNAEFGAQGSREPVMTWEWGTISNDDAS